MHSEAQRPTIAHIEDNPDNRFLIQLILQDYYNLESYESGPSGLDGIRRNRPDVVLLDISLPDMNGLEVLRELRADESMKYLPVIALTAHAMKGDAERFLKAGFDEYLTKPIVDEGLLLAAIQRCVTGREEKDQNG